MERYAYDPYGRRSVFTPVDGSDAFGLDPQTQATRVKVGGVDQAYPIMLFGHQGLMHDEHIDLVYNRARYFDVRLGRFISRDPLGYVDGMSLYAYYPGMYGGVDPYGLWWNPITWADQKLGQAGAYVLTGTWVDADQASAAALSRSSTRGSVTGLKALGNATIDTGANLVTLGQAGQLNVIPINNYDRAIGYDASYAANRIATELAGGLVTGGASHLDLLTKWHTTC